MAIDVDSLVAPLGEAAPSGPDLSYESERQQIELAFERSISVDSAETADDAFDWRETIALIEGEAAKTRDLWLPVYLMRAAVHSGNFALLAQAAEFLARLLEERWPDVHPTLDEYGFIGRKTPCESLTRIGDFLAPLSRVPLIEHPRLGRFSGADFERFHKDGSGAENYGMFRALLDATEPDDLRAVAEKVSALEGAIRRADAVLTANAEGDTATNFQPTYEALGGMRAAIAAFLPGEAAAAAAPAADGVAGAGGAGGVAPGASGAGFSGGISSRDDVLRALDAISAYYARAEPASPVPFALRRAREWISLDFLAVLEDIAPGSLDEASRVLKSGRTSSGGSVSDEQSSSDSSW